MNPQNIQKAKELMEKGWKLREEYKFNEAETNLTEARQIFIVEQDWFNVTESMCHLAYSYKLQAKKYIDDGVEIAKNAIELTKAKGTKDAGARRAIISLLDSAGKYEEAIKYLVTSISQQDNIAAKGDLQSHLAMCYLRTGNADQALAMVDESLKNIEAGWDKERDPHRSIWKSKALAAKSLILFNFSKLVEAKQLANSSLEVAKAVNIQTRIQQAQDLIKFLNEN